MEKEFKGINHGKGLIDVSKYKYINEVRPVEIHLKEDGSKKNEPSFAIVMQASGVAHVFGQISLEMFNDGLADIGYEIIKKIKPNEYKCAMCNQIFECGRSDQEAKEEFEGNFGRAVRNEDAILCDDCFKKIIPVIQN